MIIDAHAHLVAPHSLYAHRSQLIVSGGQYGDDFHATVGEAELAASAANNVKLMDEVGTDVQLLSPRPYLMLNGKARWAEIKSWAEDNNNAIARTIKMCPTRFRGVCSLPQQAGRPVESLFDEMRRCTEELGFVGVLLNPDPGEGSSTTPPLGDEYWYPLYERLCELDIPAHIHSGNCCNGRETYDEHFIAEESLAITSLYRADIFSRFPGLKLMISHGGGAIPYQVGRWRSHREMARDRGGVPKDAPSFDDFVRHLWYDTVLHNARSLDLLFDVVGADRCCFGTERPGSGSGIDPLSGRPYDDLRTTIVELGTLNQDELDAVFEKNALQLFNRVKV